MVTEKVDSLPYEAMFICPADVPQRDMDVVTEKVKKTLADAGANVVSVQNWGRRRLAYPIKRQREGVYFYVDFAGNNQCSAALNNLFRVTDKVIRHIVVRKDVVIPQIGRTPAAPAPAADAKTETPPSPASPTVSKTNEAPSPK